MRNTKNEQKNRIAGALFGVAVGDAIGGPLEFMHHGDIAQKYGRVTTMVGGGWLSLAPGEITDDTQMTICVADGIRKNPEEPITEIGRNFITWANRGPKDVGAACASSIWNAMHAAAGAAPSPDQWEEAAERTQRSQGRPVEGNGALMRTVYPGLFYRDNYRAEYWAMKIARMTHAGPLSTEACILYTRMINLLSASESNIQEAETPREFFTEHAETCGYTIATTAETVQPSDGGFVADSMRIALGSVATSTSFAEAIETAANLGGDADTNAAITGGLAGAWYGYDAIPEEWISSLAPEVRHILADLVDAAMDAREG